MSEPYLSMIEAFGFDFAPRGWALCAGQVLSIAQNTALFSLLETTYGGNGVNTFQLPDLRGRIALGFGQAPGLSPYPQGAAGGQEAHQLLASEAPAHTHALRATNNGQANGTNLPSRSVMMGSGYGMEPGSPAENIYSSGAPTIAMAPGAVGPAGSGSPHENRMPLLTINYCIALQGIFPTRD